MSLLEIRDYRLAFDTFDGTLHVLDGIDLSLEAGETLGIVGETGCGKSVLARSLLRLNEAPPARVVSGAILFEGKDVLSLPEKAMRRLRGRRIAMVFEDPAGYLNPLLTIGTQMEDAIRGQEAALGQARRPHRAIRMQAAELLASGGLAEPQRLLASHPHQLSGGMRQRVLIAMALAGNPTLLVAGAPTTAPDGTGRAQGVGVIAGPGAKRGLCRPSGDAMNGRLLDARGVGKPYALPRAAFQPARRLTAVAHVDLSLAPGATLGLVGESGCGKSTLARLLLRLTPPSAGRIVFYDQDITNLAEASLPPLRRRLQLVLQHPSAALDPRLPPAPPLP